MQLSETEVRVLAELYDRAIDQGQTSKNMSASNVDWTAWKANVRNKLAKRRLNRAFSMVRRRKIKYRETAMGRPFELVREPEWFREGDVVFVRGDGWEVICRLKVSELVPLMVTGNPRTCRDDLFALRMTSS